jgi:hypothetical protein
LEIFFFFLLPFHTVGILYAVSCPHFLCIDIDFLIGESPEQHHRACRETKASFGWHHFFKVIIPTGISFAAGVIYSLFLCRTIHLLLYIGNPTDWKVTYPASFTLVYVMTSMNFNQPRRLNDPKYRQLQCGSSHGFGTARALAKLMGILANGGEYLGQVLLSAKAIDDLNTPLSCEFDRVVLRHISYGPGTVVMNVGHEHNQEVTNVVCPKLVVH